MRSSPVFARAWAALPEEPALAELRRNAGSQFAPAVVEAFLAVHDRVGVRT